MALCRAFLPPSGVPAALEAALRDPAIFALTGHTMRKLTPSPLLRKWRSWHVRHWRARTMQLDLRMAVRAAAMVIQPTNYLEIGVRRGWTMAQALSSPYTRCWGVDPWQDNYALEPNPGADFVRAEMERVWPGAGKRLTLVTGYSQAVLPGLLKGVARDKGWLDLAVIDGDHEAETAWQDVRHVLPHVRVGGAVILDDLVPEPSEYPLLHIWERVKQIYGHKATFIERFDAETPLAILIRTRW